jgi:hypothetical protein
MALKLVGCGLSAIAGSVFGLWPSTLPASSDHGVSYQFSLKFRVNLRDQEASAYLLDLSERIISLVTTLSSLLILKT